MIIEHTKGPGFAPQTVLLGLAVAAALGGFARPAAALTNLVQNGNFTVTGGTRSFQFGTYNGYTNTETLAGWTSAGYNFVFLPGSTSADSTYGVGDMSLYTNPVSPLGGNYVAADSDYGTDPITQTINVIKGHQYALSFVWAGAQQTGFDGATVDTWTVSLGSQSYTTPQINVDNHGFTGWFYTTYYFTPTVTGPATLSFLAAGSPQVPPFALLAGVTLYDVPEPGALAVLGTGAVALIGLARRRRPVAESG